MRLPPQSPECVSNAAKVLERYPLAEAFFHRDANSVRIEAPADAEGNMTVLGFGNTAEEAWKDAWRNSDRAPLPPHNQRGSSTWSLKSDEVYWKDKPQPVKEPDIVSHTESGAFRPT